MKLLLSQKNLLFEEIKKTNYFNPKDFEISESYSNIKSTKIKYIESDYYFLMFNDNQYYQRININYCPGENIYKELTHQNDFSLLLFDFKNWLENLKRETNQSDLWDDLKKQFNNYKIDFNVDNSSFTEQEKSLIKNQLNLIMKSMDNISLLVEQNKQIKSEISRILLLTESLGKFDWFNLFIGTIISCITNLTVTPDNAKAIFTIIKNGLSVFQIK